jgi:hypothetical protein
MSDLSRTAAASLLLAAIALVQIETGAEAQGFIPDITISSTVPGNGDVNPYGVAFVPSNFPLGGAIAPGDILVSNFNNAPSTGNPSGIQGMGTTVVKLTPNVVNPPMQAATFFTSKPTGLTTALGVLERGFVVVGNLPNPLSAGSLQFIDRNGTVGWVLAMGRVLPDGPEPSLDLQTRHPNPLRLSLSPAEPAEMVRLLGLCPRSFPLHGFAPGIEARQGQDANQLAGGWLGLREPVAPACRRGRPFPHPATPIFRSKHSIAAGGSSEKRNRGGA